MNAGKAVCVPRPNTLLCAHRSTQELLNKDQGRCGDDGVSKIGECESKGCSGLYVSGIDASIPIYI